MLSAFQYCLYFWLSTQNGDKDLIYFFNPMCFMYNESFAQACVSLGTVSVVSGVTHGPIVVIQSGYQTL